MWQRCRSGCSRRHCWGARALFSQPAIRSRSVTQNHLSKKARGLLCCCGLSSRFSDGSQSWGAASPGAFTEKAGSEKAKGVTVSVSEMKSLFWDLARRRLLPGGASRLRFHLRSPAGVQFQESGGPSLTEGCGPKGQGPGVWLPSGL